MYSIIEYISLFNKFLLFLINNVDNSFFGINNNIGGDVAGADANDDTGTLDGSALILFLAFLFDDNEFVGGWDINKGCVNADADAVFLKIQSMLMMIVPILLMVAVVLIHLIIPMIIPMIMPMILPIFDYMIGPILLMVVITMEMVSKNTMKMLIVVLPRLMMVVEEYHNQSSQN